MANPIHSTPINDGLVYGKITLTLLPNSGGKVTIAPDIYDFDVPGGNIFVEGKPKVTLRNFDTVVANMLVGGGKPFKIIFDGVGQLGKDNPE